MPQAEDGIQVLVVDDDEGMVVTLRDVLDSMGYPVDVATSGPEAVERVRERRPDCILMDIKMPGMTGVEAYREIKRLSPESFVIFMTAYSRSSLVEEARREGAVAVLTKPLDPEDVLNLIEETAAATPVLVVDDDVGFCRSLGDALAAQAFDVHAAQTVDEAIELFERQPRQVVILDMKLEERTGRNVVQLMKELNARVIVIQMKAFPELRAGLRTDLAMDASAWLEKPFEVEDLVGAIRQAVERHRRP